MINMYLLSRDGQPLAVADDQSFLTQFCEKTNCTNYTIEPIPVYITKDVTMIRRNHEHNHPNKKRKTVHQTA